MNNIYKKYKENKRIKQAFGLFSANIIGIPLGIVASIFMARFLKVHEFGDYRLIINLFNIGALVFSFGFYQAGNRVLLLNKDSEKSAEYYGVVLAVTLILYFAMNICIFVYASFDGNIQEKNLSVYIIYSLPFSFIYLLQKYFETMFQADNRIELLIKSRLYPQILLAIAVFLIPLSFDENGDRLAIILGAYILTQLVVCLYVLYQIKITFNNFKKNMILLWLQNVSFGLHTYIGSLFAVGCAQLSVFFISYYSSDNSGVGLYYLALTIAAPLAFIPNTIATTNYKEFSQSKLIPWRMLKITIIISCVALFFLWILVEPFINIFYGSNYANAVDLTFIVSIGVFAHGLADFFNRYMGANGRGKSLRNTSFVVGVSIVVGNMVMVPLWGEYGAAYTNIISGFVYLLSMIVSYKQFTLNKF